MPKQRALLSSRTGPSLTATGGVLIKNTMFRDSQNPTEYHHQNLAPESVAEETFPVDQPEYVHVTNLVRHSAVNQEMDEETIIVDEDDANDEIADGNVVLIDIAYKQPDGEPVRRRNPERKIRSKRGYLKNEHIMEEDFHVLDHIEQENLVASTRKSSQSKRITGNKLYKKWPGNSHEMPYYNPATLEIQPIQVPKYVSKVVKRKPKPKFFVRQRGPKSSKKKVVEKIPVETLRELVSEALEVLKDFIENSGSNELESLLEDQKSLKALVTTTVKCYL